MLTTLLAGLRRFFGLSEGPANPLEPEAPPHDWWIPKDRRAQIAAESELRRQVLIERLAEAPALEHDAAEVPSAVFDLEPGPDHPAAAPVPSHSVELNLDAFASMDDVAAIMADRRRVQDEERRRVESIELPQAMMMDDDEYAVARDWMADHRTVHPLPKTQIYGQYWVRFGRSSIGDSVSVGCTTCGRSKVLTDLSGSAEPAARQDTGTMQSSYTV